MGKHCEGHHIFGESKKGYAGGGSFQLYAQGGSVKKVRTAGTNKTTPKEVKPQARVKSTAPSEVKMPPKKASLSTQISQKPAMRHGGVLGNFGKSLSMGFSKAKDAAKEAGLKTERVERSNAGEVEPKIRKNRGLGLKIKMQRSGSPLRVAAKQTMEKMKKPGAFPSLQSGPKIKNLAGATLKKTKSINVTPPEEKTPTQSNPPMKHGGSARKNLSQTIKGMKKKKFRDFD